MAHPAPSSGGQPICAWTEASRKFAIHVRPDVIVRLGTDSRVAFKKVPRRGLEIGGILLGQADSREDTTTFWIEGFVAVESEHRYGPSYVLSEADFGRFQAEIAKNASASLGIYRSQTRSEQLVAQQPDVDLFARCFDTDDALFLMLGPVAGRAALFIRSNGNLKSIHEFPLASSLVKAQELTPVAEISLPADPAPEIAPEEEQVSKPPEEVDTTEVSREDATREMDQQRHLRTALKVKFIAGNQPAAAPVAIDTAGAKPASIHAVGDGLGKLSDPSRARSLLGRSLAVGNTRWVLAAILSALVVAATLGVRNYSSPRSAMPAARPPDEIRLSVERAGSSLRVLWDRNSPAMRGATRAVLHIQDGTAQSDRNLAPSELTAGSLTYEPKSSELAFRLDVYSVEPHATGLVQVMTVPQPSTTLPAAPVGPGVRQAAKRSLNRRLPALPSSPTRQEPASSPLVARKEEILADKATEGKSEASPPDTRSASAPKAPEVPQERLQSEAAPASPTPDRQPSVRVVPEPVSGSRLGRVVGRVPLLRRLTKQGRFAEPVPVYQAQPSWKVPNEGLSQPVSVVVKVSVGDSGAVKSAQVVEYGDPPNFTLANAALAAALRWTFKPARMEDQPVSSEVILHFRFSP